MHVRAPSFLPRIPARGPDARPWLPSALVPMSANEHLDPDRLLRRAAPAHSGRREAVRADQWGCELATVRGYATRFVQLWPSQNRQVPSFEGSAYHPAVGAGGCEGARRRMAAMISATAPTVLAATTTTPEATAIPLASVPVSGACSALTIMITDTTPQAMHPNAPRRHRRFRRAQRGRGSPAVTGLMRTSCQNRANHSRCPGCALARTFRGSGGDARPAFPRVDGSLLLDRWCAPGRF